jgi:hypothetical protein
MTLQPISHLNFLIYEEKKIFILFFISVPFEPVTTVEIKGEVLKFLIHTANGAYRNLGKKGLYNLAVPPPYSSEMQEKINNFRTKKV